MLGAEFWSREREILLGLLIPRLEGLAIAGTMAAADKLGAGGITFDPNLVHAEAARWARSYADQLADQLNRTSESTIEGIVASWVETSGATMGDLAERLRPLVGDNLARAEVVATTEVTTVFAQGEAIVYQQAGIGRVVFPPPGHPRCRCGTGVQRLGNGDLVAVWLTNRDEVVCRTPIRTPWGMVEGCRAMHRTVISEGPYLGQRV